MGFTFWNEWQKNIDLFHDIHIFLDVPVYHVNDISYEAFSWIIWYNLLC